MIELKLLVLESSDVTDNMRPLHTAKNKYAVEQADIVVFHGTVYKNRYGSVTGQVLRLK